MAFGKEEKVEYLRCLVTNQISFAGDFYDEIHDNSRDFLGGDLEDVEKDYALARSILLDYDPEAGEEFSEDLWTEVDKWFEKIQEETGQC